MIEVNSFNGFDPLREVWLGGVYPEDFYYDFDPEIKDAFVKITNETNEDLDRIQRALELKNIKVQRPTFDNNRENYIGHNKFLIKPPIMIRDTEFVLGNTFYHLRADYKSDPLKKQIDQMVSSGINLRLAPTGTDLSCLQPPSVTRCGKDLYVDIDSHSHVVPMISETFMYWAKDYRVHLISTGGHSDSVFCPIQEGLIITTHWLDEYDKTFPGWEVYKLPMETPPTAGSDKNW